MLSRCSSYIDKFLSFSKNCFELPNNPNRVTLKRAILDATIGRPIEPFIKWLDKSGKQNLMKCVSSECPVTCSPKKKMGISPIESSPLKIIQSSKKLRHYLMIPESQACRGCIKRSRCKNFLQVDQRIPDLSDIARVVLGMNTMCNLYIDNYELIQQEDGSLSNICSFFSLLNSLEQYLLIVKEENGSLKVQRGDDKECSIEASKQMKKQMISKLEEKLSKMCNIPVYMYQTLKPNPKTKITKNQRLLQDRLNRLMGNDKNEKDNEFVWIPEPDDNTNEDNLSNAVDDDNNKYSISFGNETKIIQLDTLKDEQVEFRLSRDASNVSHEEIKNYNINEDKIMSFIKIDNSTLVNLNNSNYQNYQNYINRYKGKRLKNSSHLTQILEYVDSNKAKKSLTNVIRVPFETPSQSSGNSIPPIIDRRNTVGSEIICKETLDFHDIYSNDEYKNYHN